MPRNRLLLALLVLFLSVSLWAQEQLTTAVYFPVDGYKLDGEAQTQLDQLLKDLDHVDHWKLDIRAHTDATGTNAYNDDLAQKRAKAVRTYLIGKGLPLDWVTISAFGELQPAESNATEKGRSLNRRVDLDLQIWALNGLEDLMTGLRGDDSQYFTFDAGQSVSLTGKEGTTLWIPADLFVDENGQTASGKIQLEMREAYTYADMLFQGLSTHSGDQMLETGGMVYLQATSEKGKKLQIKEAEALIMAMPTGQQLEGMQLFNGQVSASGDLEDWIPTGQDAQTTKMATLRLADPPPMPQVKTKLTFFKVDESGEPQAPTRPLEPVFPKEPKRESVKYDPGFMKRMVMGKKKILEKEEAIFAKKMAQYEARKEKYPMQMEVYRSEMASYTLEMQAYHEAVAAWKAGMQEQWQAHQAKRVEKYNEAYAETAEKYRRTLEAYEAYKARKLAEYEAAVEMGGMNQQSMENYFYAINTLGWINCDRFYNLADSEKEPLLVNDDDPEEEIIFVFLSDIKSALRTRQDNGVYTTQSVPTGAKAKVVGLKVLNGRSMMAVKEVNVGEVESVALDYKPRRLFEIRETLAALD